MPRPQIVIDNPILNAPYDAPERHFRFDDDGITDEVVEGRRRSSYFMPIPKARRKGGQLVFDEWTGDRIEENQFINRIRERIQRWRVEGRPHVTPTTRALLEYWTDPDRERPLFFCQIEALETAIYLTEVARTHGDAWIDNELRTFAEDANPGLFRMAHKMATGTGKTVVMAMLIAWHPQQGGQHEGPSIRRRLPRRRSRHHHPRPPPGAAAIGPGQLLPAAGHRAGRPAGPRSSSPTSTASGCGRRSRRRS